MDVLARPSRLAVAPDLVQLTPIGTAAFAAFLVASAGLVDADSIFPQALSPGQIDPDQLGGRFSINACTPSSALGSIMLQAIVWAACS